MYCVKSVGIWSFHDPNFHVFGLNTGDLQSKSLYAARMRKNKDQKSSKCGHFLRSDVVVKEMFEQKMKKQPLKSVL